MEQEQEEKEQEEQEEEQEQEQEEEQEEEGGMQKGERKKKERKKERKEKKKTRQSTYLSVRERLLKRFKVFAGPGNKFLGVKLVIKKSGKNSIHLKSLELGLPLQSCQFVVTPGWIREVSLLHSSLSG